MVTIQCRNSIDKHTLLKSPEAEIEKETRTLLATDQLADLEMDNTLKRWHGPQAR